RGIYRSLDGGVTWQRVLYRDQDAGGSAVAIDPSRPDIVYAALWQSRLGPWEDKNEFQGTGGGLFKSTDGGTTWKPLTAGLPSNLVQVNIAIAPSAPQRLYAAAGTSEPGDYSSAAGLGVFRSDDAGESWSSWFNQPTAQLFHVSVTPTFPYQVCAAQQESGSVCIASRGNDGEITDRDWHPVGAIEYGYVAPDPLDPDVIYGGGRNEVSKFHRSTGQVQNVTPIPVRGAEVRVDRTEPLMFSPVDPHTLYF